jgi:hypothetical protein
MSGKGPSPHRALLWLVVFCVVSPAAFAQKWVPFVGIQRQTAYKLLPSGKQLASETEGVFMRNSDGSVYSHNSPVFGLPPSARLPAHVQDASTGILYVINHAQKTATPMRELSNPSPLRIPTEPPVPADATPLGQKMIAGVQCVGYRLPATGGVTVEIWFAPSLNYLTVSARTTIVAEKKEIDMDMVSIEPGTEPDARYFQLPGDPKAGLSAH